MNKNIIDFLSFFSNLNFAFTIGSIVARWVFQLRLKINTVSSECGARAEFADTKFSHNLPYFFWVCTPSPIFFSNFRIQTLFVLLRGSRKFSIFLGIFVLHFRYFKFIAWVSRFFEICTSDFSSLLVMGANVFLVPLILHWKGP